MKTTAILKLFTLITIAVLFLKLPVMAQLTDVGGVSINLDNAPPAKCAILDVTSTEKGVLIPRMTLVQRDAIPVADLVEGTTVYIIDNDPNLSYETIGFWYYSGTTWKQLQPASPGNKVPRGGIIMYSGEFSNFDPQTGIGEEGSEMEGWALCDGQGGRPDLRGRFIVGGFDATNNTDSYADYDYTGPGNGQNQIQIQVQNLPNHPHQTIVDGNGTVTGTVSASGTTGIQDVKHTHKVQGAGAAGEPNTTVDGFNVATYHENDGTIATMTEDYADGVNGHKHNFSFSSSISGGAVDLSTVTVEVTSDFANQKIDNRPPYYVLAFIIRIDTGDSFDGTYQIPVTPAQ